MRKGTVWQIEVGGLRAIPTQNMAEDRWLALRRGGIGGSDISAITGRSPWKTSLGLWCEKVGLSPQREPTEAMEFGIRMEPTLRAWAQDWLNKQFNGFPALQVLSSPYLYQIEQQEIFLANLDGIVLAGEERTEWAGLELKTVDRFAAKEWEDGETPAYYQEQVQWYMGITGLKRWVVCALIGKRFEGRVIERDDEKIRDLQQAAAGWWTTYVLTRQMPPATGEDAPLLLDMFKDQSEDIIQAPELEYSITAFQEAKALVKGQEKFIDDIKALLEQRIGANKGLQAGGYLVTWSRFKQERVDSKKLKAEYPEVYQAVAKETPSGRLNVKGAKT
jgi:putative phage-type endonuclease